LAASGIRFNDYFFTDPVALTAWVPPKCAGLLCILASDPDWAPKAFQPLYFGEFGNNSQPAVLLRECNQVAAVARAKNNSALLFISVLAMPFSTTQQRWTLRNELIAAYNPPYQTGPPSQTADSSFRDVPLVEPPPAPRRRIGFVDFSGPAA
jgi:hypothetical protein